MMLELQQFRELKWVFQFPNLHQFMGMHRGRTRGVGADFYQYRPYQQGDESQHVDWKLFARSDRLYIKESEKESFQHIHFWLDHSASMDEVSSTYPERSKSQYAKHILAGLTYILWKQGDRFSGNWLNFKLPPHGSADLFYQHLDRLQKASGDHSHQEQGHFIGIFDGIGKPNKVLDQLNLAGPTSKKLVILLNCDKELDFTSQKPNLFVDRETGQKKWAEPKNNGYEFNFKKARIKLKKKLVRHGCHVLEWTIEKPIFKAIKQVTGSFQ